MVKTKGGPDYVCVCCHRLMYKQSVLHLKVQKYVKATPELLSDALNPKYVYTSFDGNR